MPPAPGPYGVVAAGTWHGRDLACRMDVSHGRPGAGRDIAVGPGLAHPEIATVKTHAEIPPAVI